MYGEKAGVPFAPVGIYDFTNSLVTTVESDFNGMYDVLLPSTNHISCPTPSGVCAGMYRFVGNDPGVPGPAQPELQPALPHDRHRVRGPAGRHHPADLAPTQVGLTVESPQTGLPKDVSCPVAPTTPQLFARLQALRDAGSRSFTIEGTGFGASQGTGSVSLDGTRAVRDGLVRHLASP